MGKKNDLTPEKKTDNRADNPQENPPDQKIRIAAVLLAIAVLGGVIFFGLPFLNAPSSPRGVGGPVTVYYFYGAECEYCHEVTPYIQSLQKKYPEVNFQILEIWHDETNQAIYKLQNHKLGKEPNAIPQVIVGNVSLVGATEIKDDLESVILAQKGNLTGSAQLGAVPVTGSSSPSDTSATIPATYFYGNGCSHCEEVKPLIADLQARYPELRLEMLEINDNKTNRETLLATYPRYGLSGGSIPSVFIGEYALVGEQEVKDHFEEKILAEKQRIASGRPGNLTTTAPGVLPAGISNRSVSAVFFYSDSCSHCEKIKPLIANISARYPSLNLSTLEVNHNADNRQLFNDLCSDNGISNPGVPCIFIGNSILIGEGDITNRFEGEILAEQQRIANGTPLNQTPVNTSTRQPPATPALSPFMVVFAALVDSANPCGLSVLVFLLISMAAAGDRKRILLVGGVYIAAMFLFHLFVGIGLFSAFSLSGLAKPFSIIGGLVALLLGIVTLIDVLRNRESYLLSIPESGKGLLGTYIRKATLPAAFILGILAGILGFSCTGGIYISILGLMGRDMTMMAGLPWLILYNLIFVLPLVFITLLVAYGVSPERADRWRTENKRAVRVVIGVILVALGVVILSGWLG